jgi:sulfur carrier protein ThiS
MERLTQAQLTKIVGEVERLSQQRQEEIDRTQLEDILRELGLPLELLGDALIQLQRREALAIQQKRRRWIVRSVLAGVVVVVAGVGFLFQQNQQMLARISAQQDRVTLAQEAGGKVTTVSRQTNPELIYQVTLKDAPISKTLDLSCDWVAPNGQVVKQNRYQTREISTSIWETHCRYQLGSASPTGTWQVRMLLGDRRLSDASFEVK